VWSVPHPKPAGEPAAKSVREPDDKLEKSLYSEDWICQFKGTPLFKEAKKLCEQELSMQEAQLKRREERAKHDKARSAALDKLAKPESYDWQAEDTAREKIRIAKQRLILKLAEHHQGG
jgi:hypothetical protein